MKNILVINGHPVRDSFSSVLTKAYVESAESSNFKVSNTVLHELDFNPNLEFGYKKRMKVEPDIEDAIEKIKQADHIVWVYPMWWYGMPALLKGFIDRTFLPEIAFKSRIGKLPEKLFKGKTSRIIITSDTPRWYDFLFMKSPALNQMKRGVLEFTGIKPVRVTFISPIKNSSIKFRQKWIEKVELIGRKGL